MTRRTRRLGLIAVALAVVALASGIAVFALSDNIVFFYSPTEVVDKPVPVGSHVRVGGIVKRDTLVKSADEHVSFIVTDGAHDLNVTFRGLLPDLLREGQGVVAEGLISAPGEMKAGAVLAKHDERYMPREVVEALKKQGRWQETESATR